MKLHSAALMALAFLFAGFPAHADIFGPDPAFLYPMTVQSAPMPPEYVQNSSNTAFSGTTISTTLTGVGPGHDLRVAVWNNPNTSTITVSDGTACTLIANSGTGDPTYLMQLADCPYVAGGSVTVTATMSAATGAAYILVEEWALDASSPVDGGSAQYTADGTGGTVLASGSFTTTTPYDDIWCAMLQEQSVAPTVGPGFTLRTSGTAAAAGIFSEDMVQSVAGAINPYFLSGAGADDNSVGCGAFKPPR